MSEELEPEEQQEQQLRQEYGWLYDRLLELLFEHDPVQLAAFGAPKDEYSVEVDEFLPLLKEIHSPVMVSQVLYKVFAHMFDEKMIFPRRAMFDPLAEEIWNVYQSWHDESV